MGNRYIVQSVLLDLIGLNRKIKIIAFILVLSIPFSVAVAKNGDPLISIQHANHALGFSSNGIYVAGGDHLFSVGFLNSEKVEPLTVFDESDPPGQVRSRTVHYSGLWSGIDLKYEMSDSGIFESVWELAPGSNPESILLKYNAPATIEQNGALNIPYATGWMQESAPIAWQVIDDQKVYIDIAFEERSIGSLSNTNIGFDLSEYDPDYTLWIDPVLQWHTFLGSALNDTASAIVIGDGGTVFVTGTSNSTWGNPILAHDGGLQAYVARLGANGALLWNTFLGNDLTIFNGVAATVSTGIAVDSANNNVFVTGYSNANWGDALILTPHTANADFDGFVTKLNQLTGAMVFNTFFGSLGSDQMEDIAVDSEDNFIVTGRSTLRWGTPIQSISTTRGGVVVAKFNSAGVREWHTFIGSLGFANGEIDSGNAVAVDSNDDIYVAGSSVASWGSPIVSYTSGAEGFLAKLDGTSGTGSTGTVLWNTFLGRSLQAPFFGTDRANGVTVSTVGLTDSIYVSGYSNGPWGSPLSSFGTTGIRFDTFLAKFNTSGAREWNTFMGSDAGANFGPSTDIVSNNLGDIFLTSSSNKQWGGPLAPYSGGGDAYVVKTSSSGSFLWHAYVGGSGTETGVSIDLFGESPFVAGTASATWGSPIGAHSGNTDGFVARVSIPYTAATAVSGMGGSFSPVSQLKFSGDSVSFNVNPDVGYSADNVSGCGGTWSGSNPYVTAPLITDCQISATFSLNNYLVNASTDANGSLNTVSVNVNHGDTATFIVTPDSGFLTDQVIGGTCPQGSFSGASYTTGVIMSACSVSFTHSIARTVTGSIDTNGSLPSPVMEIVDGTTATFSPAANTGFILDEDVVGTCPAGSWSEGNTSYTTGAISSDCSVVFSTVQGFTVTPSVVTPVGLGLHGTGSVKGGPVLNGSISPNTPQLIPVGDTTQFELFPSFGFVPIVAGTCGGNLISNIYTTNEITADCSVEASFISAAPPVIAEGEQVTIIIDEDNSPVSFVLILNASDPNGRLLTWRISDGASLGVASTSGGGNAKAIGYVPYLNETGNDTFEVEVSNGATIDTILVNVTINPVDDAPFVSDPIEDISVDEDDEDLTLIIQQELEKSLKNAVSNTFTDTDSDTLSITLVSNTNPTVVSASLSEFELTLGFLENQNGETDVTLRATADGKSVDETFRVTVLPENDPPVITTAELTYNNGNSAVGMLQASDIENDSVTFSLIGGDDVALFDVTAEGMVSFLSPPDTANPTDVGTDNEYDIIVEAFDGIDTDVRGIRITEDNGDDLIIIPLPGGKAIAVPL